MTALTITFLEPVDGAKAGEVYRLIRWLLGHPHPADKVAEFIDAAGTNINVKMVGGHAVTAVPTPADIEKYGPLTRDEIRHLFRPGRPGPLQDGAQVCREGNGTVYVYGWADDNTAEYMARMFGRGTGAVVEIQRVSLMFTRLPFDGRTNPEAPWWSTVVPPGAPGSVPVTVVRFEVTR